MKASSAASRHWGLAVFSPVLPQAIEAFQISADPDSSNTSSEHSSSSLSKDTFLKAWTFS